MQNLLPGRKFLFLQFLLGYLFLLCNLLFWFRNNLYFFSKNHLHVAGRAGELMYGLIRPWVSSTSHLGGFVHLDVLNNRESTSKPLSSALLSAFLSMCSKNSALFLGHWLCPAPLFGLRTPTNSTIVASEWHTLLLRSDIFQILGGFLDMHTLDGLGSFMRVLKVNTKIWTSWFAWFCRVFWVQRVANHLRRSPQATRVLYVQL